MGLAQTGAVILPASGLLHGWTWPHVKKGLVDLAYLTPATGSERCTGKNCALE